MTVLYLMAEVIPLPCCVMLIAAAFIMQLLCCVTLQRRLLKAVPAYLLMLGGVCGALRCIGTIGVAGAVSGGMLQGLMLLCGVGVSTLGMLAAWLVYLLVRLFALENSIR